MDWSGCKSPPITGQRRMFMVLRLYRTPVRDGILQVRKRKRSSRRVAALLPGALERWRTAPAEGVHSDEVGHEVAGLKFENAQIIASAAALVLIPHLASPPLAAIRSVCAKRLAAKCARSKTQLQEKKLPRKRKLDLIGGANAERTRDLHLSV